MRIDIACALLGLSSNDLTEEGIQKSYRAAIQLNHPDRFSGNPILRAHAEEQCKRINEARKTLLDYLANPSRQSAQSTQSGQSTESARSTQPHQSTHSDQYARSAQSSESTRSDHSANPDQSTNSTHSTRSTQYTQSAKPTQNTPFLDRWSTSYGYAILGAILSIIVIYFEDYVPESALMVTWIIRLVYMIIQFLYSILVYPTLFGSHPRARAADEVSFFNCAFGGPIFGAIWNGNLTNRRKGISYIVFAVLQGLLIVLWILALGSITTLMAIYN